MTFDEWLNNNPIDECDECEVKTFINCEHCFYRGLKEVEYQVQKAIDLAKLKEYK